MATIKFYVERKKDKEGNPIKKDLPIYVYIQFSGQRKKYFIKKRIDEKDWSFSNGKAKNSYQHSVSLNGYLKDLRDEVEELETLALKNRVRFTKEYLDNNFSLGKKPGGDVFELFDRFLLCEKKAKSLSHGTIKHLTTVKNHLERFCKYKNINPSIDEMDDDFVFAFEDFCRDVLGNINTTAELRSKWLRWFLNWARNKNRKVKRKAVVDQKPIVFLTWDEVNRLMKFEPKQNYLKNAKDLYLFGCFTGLRHSDWKNMKKSYIQGDVIRIVSQKTQKDLIVPICEPLKEIIDRNMINEGDNLLNVPTDQVLNRFLKELFERFFEEIKQVDQQVTKIVYRGNERIEITKPRYECLTTHTAKKTFVTNARKFDIGIDTVCKITGNSRKTIDFYYNIDEDEILKVAHKFNTAFMKVV